MSILYSNTAYFIVTAYHGIYVGYKT